MFVCVERSTRVPCKDQHECLVSVTAVYVVEAYLNVCLSWLRGGSGRFLVLLLSDWLVFC